MPGKRKQQFEMCIRDSLGAAGGVEFITCVKSLQEGFIHQTVGTKEPDEGCDLDYVIGAPMKKAVSYTHLKRVYHFRFWYRLQELL